MATQAQITINGVAGSNVDLPLNTLVQLNNNGAGGETTYEWTLISQPTGIPNATLSSTSIQAPTFTPNKEGTYLLQLVVNKGLSDEKTDLVVAAVRELETHNRIPALGETTEAGVTEGWAVNAVNEILQRVTRLTDAGMFVAHASEALVAGNVVHMSGTYTLASGLPGERKVASVNKALATVQEYTDGPLGVVISDTHGNSSIASGDLCRVMIVGALPSYNLGAGGTAGDPVYVDDTGSLSLTAGTYVRSVGDIALDHGDNTYDISISAASSTLPTGAAGGDLSGFYPNPTVVKIQGKSVDVPAAGYAFYNSGTSTVKWQNLDLTASTYITGPLPYTKGGTGLATPGITSQVLLGNPAGPTWGQVDQAQIATGAVVESKIGTGAVTAGKIGTGAVTADKIGAGAVTPSKVATAFSYNYIEAGSQTGVIGYQTLGSVTATTTGGFFKIAVQPSSAGESFFFLANNPNASTNFEYYVQVTVAGPTNRSYTYMTLVNKNTSNISLHVPSIADVFTAGSYTVTLKAALPVSGGNAVGSISWGRMVLVMYEP